MYTSQLGYTDYHLEARIASWHCQKEDTPEKWQDVLVLYDQLLLLNSPNFALNRIYALYNVKGHEAALQEVEKLKWEDNHFYYLLLGELYRHQDKKKSAFNFQKACELSKTETEKKNLQLKIEKLNTSTKTS